MFFERLGIASAEGLEEARRPLDVREQEGNRPGRQIRHRVTPQLVVQPKLLLKDAAEAFGGLDHDRRSPSPHRFVEPSAHETGGAGWAPVQAVLVVWGGSVTAAGTAWVFIDP
jgi:hypothetical protein